MSNWKQLKPGDTVVWDHRTLNPEYWNNLSEKDRVLFYGPLGYGQANPPYFTFLCHHSPQSGHCCLVNMETQQIETMRHTSEFRALTEDEC